MKILYFLLFKLITLNKPSCKMHLLQSYGFESMVNPNEKNNTCNYIKNNCCTVNDQLYIHKWYSTIMKEELGKNRDKYLRQITDIQNIVSDIRTSFPFQDIWKAYKDNKLPTNTKFEAHIEKLQEFIFQEPQLIIIEKEQIQEEVQKFVDEIYSIRNSFPCLLCDFDNHKFFDVENQVIHLSQNFVEEFIKNHKQYLFDILYPILQYLLAFQEVVYYLTYIQIIPNPEYRGILFNYLKNLKECKEDIKSQGCKEICKELNINKYTALYDGKAKLFAEIKIAFDENRLLLLDKKNVKKLYQKRDQILQELEKKKDDAESQSQPSYNLLENVELKSIRTNSLKLSDMPKSIVKILQNKDKPSNFKLQPYEDETTVYSVFTLKPISLDLSKLQNKISEDGIDLILHSKEIDMEIPIEELIKIIVIEQQKKSDKEHVLNEKIQEVIKNVSKNNIKEFINDLNVTFLRVKKQDIKKYVTEKEQSVVKNSFLFASIPNMMIQTIFSFLVLFIQF